MRTQFDHARMTVMQNLEVFFICVCVLSFCFQCLTVENVECRKINGCKCVMPDGVRIDLTRLSDDAEWYVSDCNLSFLGLFDHKRTSQLVNDPTYVLRIL
jgi:hypothetical protein